MGVQRQSKREYLARMQEGYLQATKPEKGRLLDEVVAVTGYHRRHAVRVLRHGRFPDPALAAVQGLASPGQLPARRGSGGGGRPVGRPWVYSSVVVAALRRRLAAAVEQLGRLQECPNVLLERQPDENGLKQAG